METAENSFIGQAKQGYPLQCYRHNQPLKPYPNQIIIENICNFPGSLQCVFRISEQHQRAKQHLYEHSPHLVHPCLTNRIFGGVGKRVKKIT